MADTSTSSEDGEEVKVLTDAQFNKDYNWDIETCRGQHESDEHWSLRREFLLRNKESIPKIRLQCLSQVFVNMEFLGCKYPAETMTEVAELSVGILDEFKSKQEGSSQRTLVTASSAAQKKYNKGSLEQSFTKSEGSEVLKRRNDSESFQIHTEVKTIKMEENIELDDFDLDEANSLSEASYEKRSSFRTVPGECSPACFPGLVLVEFLYVEESPVHLLTKSCEMCGVTYKFSTSFVETESGLRSYKSEFHVGQPNNLTFYAESMSCSARESSRQGLAVQVIRILKHHVYTVQIKEAVSSESSGHEIERSVLLDNRKPSADVDGPSQSEQISTNTVISEDNVGNKLLRLMGIEEPIDVSNAIGRERFGLGHAQSASGLMRSTMISFLKDQFNTTYDSTREIVFSPEFTKDERIIIHQAASALKSLKLKSSSYGEEPERYLVVKRKVNFSQLVTELINSYNGETQKYRLIKPLTLTLKFEN